MYGWCLFACVVHEGTLPDARATTLGHPRTADTASGVPGTGFAEITLEEGIIRLRYCLRASRFF